MSPASAAPVVPLRTMPGPAWATEPPIRGGHRLVHVNTTAVGGGGVAERLQQPGLLRSYHAVLEPQAVWFASRPGTDDIVVLHDPQTLGLAPAPAPGPAAAWRGFAAELAAVDAVVTARPEFAPPSVPASRRHVVPPAIDPDARALLHAVGLTAATAGPWRLSNRRRRCPRLPASSPRCRAGTHSWTCPACCAAPMACPTTYTWFSSAPTRMPSPTAPRTARCSQTSGRCWRRWTPPIGVVSTWSRRPLPPPRRPRSSSTPCSGARTWWCSSASRRASASPSPRQWSRAAPWSPRPSAACATKSPTTTTVCSFPRETTPPPALRHALGERARTSALGRYAKTRLVADYRTVTPPTPDPVDPMQHVNNVNTVRKVTS